jgi:hypothetical protein
MHTLPFAIGLKHLSQVCLLGVCLAAFSWASPASKTSSPKPPPGQKEVFEVYPGIETLLPNIYLYTDGNGHYLAMSVKLNPAEDMKKLNTHYPRLLFWGDKGALFEQRTTGDGYYKEPGKTNDAPGVYPDASLYYDVDFWDPNMEIYSRIVRPKEGELHVVCGERKTTLRPVPLEEAQAILKKAKFYRPRFMRMPHFLARDDRGIYYYIDKSAKEGEKDFRILIGKRGQLKHTKLKNIVQDSAGEIFSTPNGSLRIVIDRNEVLWIHEKKRRVLVKMDAFVLTNGVPRASPNLRLVFGELGIYSTQKVGTPCDDL